MTKQQITIEVDVPEGYELTYCGVSESERIQWSRSGHELGGNGILYLNAQKAWQWPAWLKAEWIAMDKDGEWWAYANEPFVGKLDFWENANDSENACISHLFPFTPPPCTDWRQSKRRRPT